MTRPFLCLLAALWASSATARASPVPDLAKALRTIYVDAAVGEGMARRVEEFGHSSEARGLTGNALAAALQSAIRSVYDDRHIAVVYSQDKLQAPPDNDDAVAEAMRRTNAGYRDVRVLPGNVGYMHIETFATLDLGRRAADAAFAFVKETDALVIDMRRSQGGSPEMVAYVEGYLLDAAPRHLTSFVYRDRPERKFITAGIAEGLRYGGSKPVFVIIGPETPSASEGLAYDLQLLGRATIVGERSEGAANPGQFVLLSDHFAAFVPYARARSTISGTNWEGVGVKPDVETGVKGAAVAGYRLALETMAKGADEATAARLRRIARQDPPVLAPDH